MQSDSDKPPTPQLDYENPGQIDKPCGRARTVIGAFAVFGILSAAMYFALAVPGPPYFIEPVSGCIAGILMLPALLFQELYPDNWPIKYNHFALIITNGLLFGVVGVLKVALRGTSATRRLRLGP